MIRKTPPMGWNSWNTFGANVSEELIYEMADIMADQGFLEAGYDYLVIDDCWAEKERDKDGRLVPDHVKFPHGMKAVADYVHSKGLKFGMYSCCGVRTCANYPSSFEREFTDARTFASWGVDFLKYDYCNKPIEAEGRMLYTRMGTALANCGRDILFSGCSWGCDGTPEWIKQTGAHMWRSTGDITDCWQSIKDLYSRQYDLQKTNGQGCFNDMDMLVVGMRGNGNVGISGCTDEEYRTHYTMWAFLQSPLMIGCDMRHMDDAIRSILLNKEVIAINQDEACRQPYLLSHDSRHDVWARLLSNGDIAVAVFNLADDSTAYTDNSFCLSSLGLNRCCGKALSVRDVWAGKELGVFEDAVFGDIVPAHHCRLYRCRVVDAR